MRHVARPGAVRRFLCTAAPRPSLYVPGNPARLDRHLSTILSMEDVLLSEHRKKTQYASLVHPPADNIFQAKTSYFSTDSFFTDFFPNRLALAMGSISRPSCVGLFRTLSALRQARKNPSPCEAGLWMEIFLQTNGFVTGKHFGNVLVVHATYEDVVVGPHELC